MPRKRLPRPTDGELEILRILWERGPCTVRQVHEAISETKETAYNTTLKLIQIMTEKGTVVRDVTRRPQVFQAAAPEEDMQQHLVGDLLSRAFGGSARKLVAALIANEISDEEMAEIRDLLEEAEEV